jgi:hypothetical protein
VAKRFAERQLRLAEEFEDKKGALRSALYVLIADLTMGTDWVEYETRLEIHRKRALQLRDIAVRIVALFVS